jgi:hypothetical protein
VLIMALGLAAGFAAARALLERELPEGTPAPLREGAERAQSLLQRARDRAREALDAAREESARTQRELMADYMRRSRRR